MGEQYLAEKVMDDEQSIVAEEWWAGRFQIRSFYWLTWEDTLRQLLQAELFDKLGRPFEPSVPWRKSLEMAQSLGRWFGDHPSLIEENEGMFWVPSAQNLSVVFLKRVN